MITVSVPPTALSAAHRTETVMSAALLEGLVPVGRLSPARDGHNLFMITKSVSPPCTPAPKLHGELTLSAILNASRRPRHAKGG